LILGNADSEPRPQGAISTTFSAPCYAWRFRVAPKQ
jgi:hypothetical protein